MLITPGLGRQIRATLARFEHIRIRLRQVIQVLLPHLLGNPKPIPFILSPLGLVGFAQWIGFGPMYLMFD